MCVKVAVSDMGLGPRYTTGMLEPQLLLSNGLLLLVIVLRGCLRIAGQCRVRVCTHDQHVPNQHQYYTSVIDKQGKGYPFHPAFPGFGGDGTTC
jgi:hypothetical protein